MSGGWLRPAVFGAMDGLVTNVSLIAGVGGGGGSQHAILLTGLAGLAAGAFSMAAGEFVSVSSQNELVQAEVDKERHELTHNAAAEQIELVGMLRRQGMSAATARQAAAEISAHPDQALAVHALEELGVNPSELPSPLRGRRGVARLLRHRRDHPAASLTRSGSTRSGSRSACPRSPRSSAAAWWRGSPTGRSGAARCGSCCSARSRRASRT